MKRYSGVIVPMITPIGEDGKLDGAGVERVAAHIVEGGCNPFVIGTTGEGASLPAADREELVRRVVAVAGGRAKVYAGISTNVLDDAVAMGRRYLELGAGAVVSHPPSYFPIGAEEMLAWFERLADGIAGPLILYNIPITTHLSIPIEVADRLSRHPHVHGLKDSESGIARLEAGVRLWRDRDDFSHLIGAAEQSAHGLALGSDGIVPSAGNLVPRAYRRLYDAAGAGERGVAERIQRAIDELAALYVAGRPLGGLLAALKVMVSSVGMCGPQLLPPLARLAPDDEAALRERMRGFDPDAFADAA